MNRGLRDADFLRHVLESIAKIERFTKGKKEDDFLADELIQDGVIRNLEIIGEAVNENQRRIEQRTSRNSLVRNCGDAKSLDSWIYGGQPGNRVEYR